MNRGCRGKQRPTKGALSEAGPRLTEDGGPRTSRPPAVGGPVGNRERGGGGGVGGRCVLFAKCYSYVCGVNGLCIIFANMFCFLLRRAQCCPLVNSVQPQLPKVPQ